MHSAFGAIIVLFELKENEVVDYSNVLRRKRGEFSRSSTFLLIDLDLEGSHLHHLTFQTLGLNENTTQLTLYKLEFLVLKLLIPKIYP